MSEINRAARLAGLGDRVRGGIVEDVPQLKRGQVWCYRCGRTQTVNSGRCLASGWPTCCGETMSIDSPEERAALKSKSVTHD